MAESRAAGAAYDFAGFRLLAAERRVVTRADGRPVELTAKAFDALVHLVQHRGQLLDKTALLKAIWPNVVVEENNLNQVISALRRALGDSGGERFIVTVPGRGYQFVAPVAEVADADVAAAPRVAKRVALAASSDAAPKASIAVLPFASLSSDPEKDFFGDGIAEELIHLLARVPGLKVPARTSSFAYKGRNIDVRHIARDLGVALLLEGSVRSAGDRIRVTAQLVDAESGFHVWSQTYDRQFADVFRLQDELAGAIVQALKINLGDGGPRLLREAAPSKDVEAYRLYLQARALWNPAFMDRDKGERTIALLKSSIARDPGYARAYAQLGATLYMLYSIGIYGADSLAEAQRNVEHALELDPDVADAYAVLGAQHSVRGEWLAAEAAFRRARELEPGESTTHGAYAIYILLPAGKLEQAIAEAHESLRLAPGVISGAFSLAGLYSIAGRDDLAAEYARMVADAGISARQPPLPIFRSQVARRLGQYATAAEEMAQALPPSVMAQGGDEALKQVYGALADPGKGPAAVAALRALDERADPAVMGSWPTTVIMLNSYVLLGALDEAYASVERTVQRFETSGILNTINLGPLWLPELREFRRDPRFQDLTRRLGLLDYWKVRGPPDGCELKDGRLVVP